MNALCLGLAGAIWASLPAAPFTLAWQHSVEHVRWEEDWRISGARLELVAARVQGSGAGMEAPPDAQWLDGVWHYRPHVAPLFSLRLGRTPEVGDYQLCQNGRCQTLAHWLGPPSHAAPAVELWPCAAGAENDPAPAARH